MRKVKAVIPHGGYTDEPVQFEMKDGSYIRPSQIDAIYIVTKEEAKEMRDDLL